MFGPLSRGEFDINRTKVNRDAAEMMSHRVTRLALALQAFDPATPRLQAWGSTAAKVLTTGGRLLACASAAGSRELAHHLVAELRTPAGSDRPSLAAEAITPAGNHGSVVDVSTRCQSLAEQVESRGRPGDVLISLSAAGPEEGVLAAAKAADACGLTAWALTGPTAAALAEASTDAIAVPDDDAKLVEEIHLVAIHVFCAAVDSRVRDRVRASRLTARVA